ncbi:MAG: AbrB/MazE/SpoVT family DNA-binding domain-containing protein [Acidimicrobiia bacterium]
MARKLDSLGRVVIPIEIRRALGWHDGDLINIGVEEDHVILGRLAPSCVFCGSSADLSEFRNQLVCVHCTAELGGAPAPTAPPAAPESAPTSTS